MNSDDKDKTNKKIKISEQQKKEEEKTFEIKKSKEEDNNIIKYDRKNSKHKLTIDSSYIIIEKRDNIKKRLKNIGSVRKMSNLY